MRNANAALYNKMRNDFFMKFHKIIVPQISKFENDRKIMLFLAISIPLSLLITGIVIIIYQIITNAGLGNVQCTVIIGGSIFLAALGVPWLLKKKFEHILKSKAMPIVCGCFENLKWNSKKNKTYSKSGMFFKSGVLKKFTDEYYDDMFKGSYKDVAFDIVECTFHRGSEEHRETIFSGVMVVLNMNKNFTGHTVIKPSTAKKQSPVKNLKHTELEDIEFNRKFDVYTNDEVDARYLITPSFMQRLKNIKSVYRAPSVSCAFYEKQCIIALPTSKDLFSIGSLIKPVVDEEQFAKMFEEILSIIKLIDHFKFNEKTNL